LQKKYHVWINTGSKLYVDSKKHSDSDELTTVK